MTSRRQSDPLALDDFTDLYLFTTPPRTVTRDHHKTIQIQKLNKGAKRINPILNLEYHRMYPTRIIEMEDDDQKLCEFHHPSRRKNERLSGGKIISSRDQRGLFDITVIGSDAQGLLLFQLGDGSALTWTKRVRDGVSWVLDEPHASSVMRGLDPPLPVRTRTGDSLYTIHHPNESQISDLSETYGDTPPRGILHASPVPHMRLRKDGSVHKTDRRHYTILISALWIVYASEDFIQVDREDPDLRVPSRMPIDPSSPSMASIKPLQRKKGFWQRLICS